MDAPIVLCTLNARYIHASLGLRYLLANMDRHGGAGLRARTVLREFTVQRPVDEMVQELLDLAPAVVGLGVYIWNRVPTTALVRALKARAPQIKLVLGGPEVSHAAELQEIVLLADHVITGWGDVSFPKLCRALLHGPAPLMKVIPGEQPPLDEIALPYREFSDDDLAHRLLYVEASRGCPFKCEFCLSALDKTAWAFDLDTFLSELDGLHQRGARHFKFVDRTFNLKPEASVRILQFFLDRLGQADAPLFLHFELVPDHLPERLKAAIAQFPPGVLQFEVGIQSFNPQVQALISRKQDNTQTEVNLRWLLKHSHAHIHADLIFGLPGETLESFAAGFDRLHATGVPEIQLGLLKRLPGAPIARHSAAHGMVYDAQPPYTVQTTALLDAATVQRVARMARYWELVANSGRFAQTLRLLLQAGSAFGRFLEFSDALWAWHGRTARLTPEQLVDALYLHLVQHLGLPAAQARTALLEDYRRSGARAQPECLRGWLSPTTQAVGTAAQTEQQAAAPLTPRQRRHARAQPSKIAP